MQRCQAGRNTLPQPRWKFVLVRTAFNTSTNIRKTQHHRGLSRRQPHKERSMELHVRTPRVRHNTKL